MDATVVCIDQTNTSVNGDLTHALFERNFRPNVELSGLRDLTCLLGAVTEDGEPFFSQSLEYVTADHAKHIIIPQYKEFEEDLIVVVDGTSYFRASAVTDLAGSRRVRLRTVAGLST